MMYLRLIFPTLQRNESPFTLLGQWLSTLGKKIDSATEVQDIPSESHLLL